MAKTRPDAADAGPLDISEVTDDRDVVSREPAAPAGRYLKAYPAKGATTLLIPSSDFKQYGGINHGDVTFDFRHNTFKILVGSPELSNEAAEFLAARYPETFRFVAKG